jgi:hypothetical protein
MIRTLRALPVLLPALVLLTACGSEDAGAADPAELASRARASGIAPELVYAVEAPGYTLAQQSVGVYGGDGFSATYVSRENGTQLRLTVDRGTVTADTCASQPTATGARAVCARDGDLWYRDAGQESEYAVPKKGFVIRVGGTGVPRDVLRDAARTVHRPSADELDALLPAGSAGGGPAERGDLPETGDGAPYDPPAAGG